MKQTLLFLLLAMIGMTQVLAHDSGCTRGDVTVKSGADYEIEASDEVILDGGFSVERGASFSVMPSTYR